MVRAQRVLVVDGLDETEEVLKAVLEPRGLQVNRVLGASLSEADSSETSSGPRLVVLHENGRRQPSNDWDSVPRVIIGSARREENSRQERRLGEPFRYQELIHAIESLLEESP